MQMWTSRMLALLAHFPCIALASQFDCVDIPVNPVLESTYSSAPSGDFALRDQLPQTDVPDADWHSSKYGQFGPCPMTFPIVMSSAVPGHESISWSRERVLEVAKKYIGLPYAHRHLPAMGGLDCSNFTSWIYNYGFGIRFSSNVKRQSTEAGRPLSSTESLAPGDLIYLYDPDHQQIVHVAIYMNEENVIDSTGIGVQIRPFVGRYKADFAWARRIIE